jgi:hypothetical protein
MGRKQGVDKKEPGGLAPYSICDAVIDPTPWQVPVHGEKLLVPSCFWIGQYSPLFLPSQEVENRVLVTSCVLLVLKLAVTVTVGPNRDFTKLSKTVGSGCDNKQTGFNPLFLYLPGPCHDTIYVFIDVESNKNKFAYCNIDQPPHNMQGYL